MAEPLREFQYSVRSVEQTLDGVSFELQGHGDPIARNMSVATASGAALGLLMYWPVGLLALAVSCVLGLMWWSGHPDDVVMTIGAVGIRVADRHVSFEEVVYRALQIDETLIVVGDQRLLVHDPEEEVFDALEAAVRRWRDQPSDLRDDARRAVTALVDDA